MEEEIWKDVVGYEGRYKVSNMGSVKSVDRIVHDKIGRTTKYFSKVLKQFYTDGDYLHVGLWNNEITNRQFRVNRLVAIAFIPNPDNLPQVNHKDCVKQNNKADNLEWCTAKQNTDHADLNGRRHPCMGQSHFNTNLTDEDVINIRQLRQNKVPLVELANMYKCSISTISEIANKKRWKHVLE